MLFVRNNVWPAEITPNNIIIKPIHKSAVCQSDVLFTREPITIKIAPIEAVLRSEEIVFVFIVNMFSLFFYHYWADNGGANRRAAFSRVRLSVWLGR